MDLRVSQELDVWPDDERRLSLPKENVSRCIDTLADSRAENWLKNPAELDEEPLHSAKVVENRHTETEEVDDRQHAKRKDGLFEHQVIAVDEGSSLLTEGQEIRNLISKALEDSTSNWPSDEDNTENELKECTADDRSPLYATSIS